jgi:hypothetical protein
MEGDLAMNQAVSLVVIILSCCGLGFLISITPKAWRFFRDFNAFLKLLECEEASD